MQQVCSNCRATQAMLMGNAYYCVSCGQPWKPIFLSPNNSNPSGTNPPNSIPLNPVPSNLKAPGQEYARNVYAPIQQTTPGNGVIKNGQEISNYNAPNYRIENIYNPSQDPEVSGLSNRLKNIDPANKAHQEALNVLEKSFAKKIESVITDNTGSTPQAKNYLPANNTYHVGPMNYQYLPNTPANNASVVLPASPSNIPAPAVKTPIPENSSYSVNQPPNHNINPTPPPISANTPQPRALPNQPSPHPYPENHVVGLNPLDYAATNPGIQPSNSPMPTPIMPSPIPNPIPVGQVPSPVIPNPTELPDLINSQPENLLKLSEDSGSNDTLEAKANLDQWFSDLGEKTNTSHSSLATPGSDNSKWDKLSDLFAADEVINKPSKSDTAQQDRAMPIQPTPTPAKKEDFLKEEQPLSPLVSDSISADMVADKKPTDLPPSIQVDDQAANIFENYQFATTVSSKSDRLRKIDSAGAVTSEVKFPKFEDFSTVPNEKKKKNDSLDTEVPSDSETSLSNPSHQAQTKPMLPLESPDGSEELLNQINSVAKEQNIIKNSIPQVSKLGMVIATGISLIIFAVIFWHSFSSQIAFKLTSSSLGLNVQTPENLPLKLKVGEVSKQQETLVYNLQNKETSLKVSQQKTNLNSTELINTVISSQAPTYLTKEVGESEVFIIDNKIIYWIKDGLLSKIESNTVLDDNQIESLVKSIN